jgi:hypothetical protein
MVEWMLPWSGERDNRVGLNSFPPGDPRGGNREMMSQYDTVTTPTPQIFLCRKNISQPKKVPNRKFIYLRPFPGNFWQPKIHKKLRKHTSEKYMSVCLTSESVQQKKNAGQLKKT